MIAGSGEQPPGSAPLEVSPVPARPPQPSSSASQSDLPSIRAYRARKLRPCDICRWRRKRCIIPRSGEPCTLCVSLGKPCTFLHDRQRRESASTTGQANAQGRRDSVVSEESRRSASPVRIRPAPMGLGPLPSPAVERPVGPSSAGFSALDQYGAGPSSARYPPPPSAQWHSPDGQAQSSNYCLPLQSPHVLHPTPPSAQTWTAPRQSASPLDLLHRIRSIARTGPSTSIAQQARPPSFTTYGALDDDAGQDEELFLAGTASERDALILNNLTAEAAGGSAQNSLHNPPAPGLRIRRVSPKITFVFYKSQPYGPEIRDDNDTAWSKLERLIGPHLIVNIARRLLDVEGQGFPIFSHRQGQSLHDMPETLRCFVVTAGLIYTPSLRHLHHHAYVTTMRQFRSHPPSARLWTMQVYLLDLNGREAINPTGNFIVLGLAVSLSRLLGLHEDCADWTIPQWEKDLRCNLWWALLTYDKISSITFGRVRAIHTKNEVPLPRLAPDATPSMAAFVSLCELSVLLDHFDRTCGCATSMPPLEHLSLLAFELGQWKGTATGRGLFAGSSAGPAIGNAPGVLSLRLTYMGCCLMIVRETLEHSLPLGPDALEACQQGCLKACEDIIDLVASLTPQDLGGYWSSHTPFFLSSCLTLLIRIITSSDRTDQSDNAVWQAALFALRRFVSLLVGCANDSHWDIAQLALSRAQYFIPLLSRQASEFQVTLLPLTSATSVAPVLPIDDELYDPENHQGLHDFLDSLVDTFGLEFLN